MMSKHSKTVGQKYCFTQSSGSQVSSDITVLSFRLAYGYFSFSLGLPFGSTKLYYLVTKAHVCE